VDRRSIGSWLSGPRAAAQDAGVELQYPGERLGLPESGPGAIAGFGRRLAAIAIDWALCLALAAGLLHGDGRATLAVFAIENLLLVSTLGYTVGHRVLRLRVAALDGSRPSPVAVVVRTALLCLAVPALIWDRDGRGLHDKAARTMVLRT